MAISLVNPRAGIEQFQYGLPLARGRGLSSKRSSPFPPKHSRLRPAAIPFESQQHGPGRQLCIKRFIPGLMPV